MPDKMTDNEIKKAFEEHYKQVDKGYSTHLEYGGKGDEHEEKYIYMLCDTLDLINRLKAENERLSTLAKLGNTRANDYRVMRDRALKAEAENERLNNAIDEQDIEIASLWKRIEEAKTEAYKEFAERLKKHYDEYDDYDDIYVRHIRDDIDFTLDDVVGDNNDRP